MSSITISSRFCGPPNSGNGGYVCGLIARLTDYVTTVTLKAPPPLAKELLLTVEDGKVQMRVADQLIGEAVAGELVFEAPPAPSFADAKAASRNYIGFNGHHPFPTCFVCGPEREAGDALCLYPGKINDPAVVAAPWQPDVSLADEAGYVKEEFIWAALDCPGAFAILGDENRPIVLGRMTADIWKKIKQGEDCVVIGWVMGHDGRKHYSGTAVYNEAGDLCAVGNATWIDI